MFFSSMYFQSSSDTWGASFSYTLEGPPEKIIPYTVKRPTEPSTFKFFFSIMTLASTKHEKSSQYTLNSGNQVGGERATSHAASNQMAILGTKVENSNFVVIHCWLV